MEKKAEKSVPFSRLQRHESCVDLAKVLERSRRLGTSLEQRTIVI